MAPPTSPRIEALPRGANEGIPRGPMCYPGAQARLQDRYHEAKVGAFYESEWRSPAQGEATWHATDTTCVAAVGEPAEEFTRRVLVEGYRRGWDQAERVVVLGRGALELRPHLGAGPRGGAEDRGGRLFPRSRATWGCGQGGLGRGDRTHSPMGRGPKRKPRTSPSHRRR